MAINSGLGSFDELFVPPNGGNKPGGAQQRGKANAPANKPSDGVNHDHPACENDHVHETAYVTSSAGGEITEGCIEHYYDRIVALEETVEEVKTNGKLAEYIIMGEILLNPKFKRRF